VRCEPRNAPSDRRWVADRFRQGRQSPPPHTHKESDALIARAAQLLCEGGIVAIKALGGYHLACDACNEGAVQRLRTRKRRPARPLAVMAQHADAQAICRLSAQEIALLESPAHPIVLAKRSTDAGGIAPSVAGTLPEVGIMLPATPLQHLLLEATDTPLVMTSGNLSSEPIISEEGEAHRLLGGVADAFLDNDRPIRSRYDDSVVRVIDQRVHMIRRARGYAPLPLALCTTTDSIVLATGAQQKSSFCLVRDEVAYVSQHLGNLENAQSLSNYLETLELYKKLFDLEPDLLVCDMHPEYLTSKWARAQSAYCVEVQHHHAHIAAVLAEHKVRADDEVIGIAFDGTGFGEDGAIWGGEVLIASLEGFERFAHLAYVPMPGGAAAIAHPNRMAYALLHHCKLLEHPFAHSLRDGLGTDRCLLLEQIIAKGINTPHTSSMGRLFDAVSALLGICLEERYDGQPAIELEAAIYVHDTHDTHDTDTHDTFAESEPPPYRFTFTASRQINPEPVISALLDDCMAGMPISCVARRFHDAVCALIVDLACLARKERGISTVALSGGVFMNRYLIQHAVPLLEQAGFRVLLHKELPANDGCIAYGQAAIATALLAQSLNSGILDASAPKHTALCAQEEEQEGA
jgi:hydrogenase maturation protein HypF